MIDAATSKMFKQFFEVLVPHHSSLLMKIPVVVKTTIAARIIADGFGQTLYFIIAGHAPTAVLCDPKQAQQTQSKD